MLSWDISAEGERWKEINSSLVAALKPHSWVRPLKTVYVVKVASESAASALNQRLVAIARGVKEDISILMTPTMSGGTYDGFLANDTWEKINRRTEP